MIDKEGKSWENERRENKPILSCPLFAGTNDANRSLFTAWQPERQSEKQTIANSITRISV